MDRISEHFYWAGMSRHVRNLVDSCVSCQQRRAHKANQLAPLQRMQTPDHPMKKIHCDILGPFNTTFSGNKFIVAYIDSFSKWPEAYAVSSITSDIVADTLADFISRHGCPSYIVTDNGPNLVSEAISNVYKSFGIKHIHTTTYHPQSNAQIERQHRTLINALSHIVNQNHCDWDMKLKFALLTIRTAVHSSTKLSPAVVLYGRNLNLPYSIFNQPDEINYNDTPSFCELLIPALRQIYVEVHSNLTKVAESQEKYREKTAVNKNFTVGDCVWLHTPVVKKNQCKKFAKFNSGPYTIIKKINEVNFQIELVSNPTNVQTVHVDRLSRAVERMKFPCSEPKQTADGDTMQANPSIDENPQLRNRYQYRRKRRGFIWFDRNPKITGSPQDSAADKRNSLAETEGTEGKTGDSKIDARDSQLGEAEAQRGTKQDTATSSLAPATQQPEGGTSNLECTEGENNPTRGRKKRAKGAGRMHPRNETKNRSFSENRYSFRSVNTRQNNFRY